MFELSFKKNNLINYLFIYFLYIIIKKMETSHDLVYEILANSYFQTFNIKYLTELENLGGFSSDIFEIENSIEKLFEMTYKIYEDFREESYYDEYKEKNLPDAMIIKMKDDYRFVSIFILKKYFSIFFI